MAATRYGVIVHSTHQKQFMRFENTAARSEFEAAFNAYHDSHDHDGDVPIFLDAKIADMPTQNVAVTLPLSSGVTLDGYKAHDILEYHQAIENSHRWTTYQPPTCCVPPLIALNNQFEDLVPADTFERHELSAAMQDMPNEKFLSLMESIATKGIFDNIIKVYKGQILDGWHRYRACQELGILRKLRFQVWDPKTDGDPLDYVIAQNLDRRQLPPSQIAQILLDLEKRFGHGGDRSKVSQETLTTLEALAKKGNVSVSTMKRASAIQNLDDPDTVEAVKQGKVSATKVLRDVKKGKRALRKKLVAQLKETGKIEIDADDIPKLAKQYQIPRKDVERMPAYVFDEEIAKMRNRWQKRYTTVRVEWMDNAELSKNVDWETFIEKAVVQCIFLSKETFTEADSRVKACRDYKLLENETGSLTDLAMHIRNPSLWISQLIRDAKQPLYPDWQINKATAAERQMLRVFQDTGLDAYMDPDDLAEEITKAYGFPNFITTAGADNEDPLIHLGRFQIITNALKHHAGWVQDLHKAFEAIMTEEQEVTTEEEQKDVLWDKINPAIRVWKAERTGTGAGVGHASKSMLLDATKRFHNLPKDSETTLELLEHLLCLLTMGKCYSFQRYVKHLCDGADIWEDTETQTPEKTYGHGTQAEFNTSDNAHNPTDTLTETEQIHTLIDGIEEQVNGDKTVGESQSPNSPLSADLLGDNREMWGIIIEWKRIDTDDYEKLAFLENPTDPRVRPLSMLPDRLIAELLAIAMPEQAENAALGWEAGYTAEDRHAFNEIYTAWTQRHTSELSQFPELTGQHVCKAYQDGVHNLRTNVIVPTDYIGTAIAMKNDDERLIKGLHALYGDENDAANL